MTALTLKIAKQADMALIDNPADREAIARADDELQQIEKVAAQRYEWLAALIKTARDPLEMLRMLTPIIASPQGYPAGAYTNIALEEVARRKALLQRIDDMRTRSYVGGESEADERLSATEH